MTTLDLPPAVRDYLAQLERTQPPDVIAAVLRELRVQLDAERRRRAEELFDVDSPGKLAVTLGQQQRPHLAILDRLHIRAAAGEEVRAIVVLPPRVGKTERLLKVGTAWRLARDPDCRVMQVSGSKSLVERSSRWVRDELERPEAGYRYRPRTDVRAVGDWEVQGHAGGIFVGSMSSRIIGRGADLLEVDDLIGSIKEAESKKYRDSAWAFLQGAMGRLEPRASVMVVNSRWHTDDPVGRLLREQPGMWELVHVPSLAERHGENPDTPGVCYCGDPWIGPHADLLGRAPGEPLWPERYDLPALERLRLGMGSHYFAAQHQGRPRRREGGLWREEWITDRRAPALTVEQQLEQLRPRVVAVDPSASDSDTGDEAGIVTGGRHTDTGDTVLTADLSGRMTPEAWARTALVAAVELGAVVVYERNLTPAFMRRAFATAWEGLRVEAGLAGGTVEPVLGMQPVELPSLMPQLIPVSAKVGKELRAGPVAQRYEQRRVVHAGTFPELEDQQLTWKPDTDKDSPDRLDAAVHLVTYLGDAPSSTATVEAPLGGGSGTVPTGAGAAVSRY